MLELTNFTVSINQAQLIEVVRAAVEKSNPGFLVERVDIDIAPAYNDQREYSPAHVREVSIKLKKIELHGNTR